MKRARTRAITHQKGILQPLVAATQVIKSQNILTYLVGFGTKPTTTYYPSHFDQIVLITTFHIHMLFCLALFLRSNS